MSKLGELKEQEQKIIPFGSTAEKNRIDNLRIEPSVVELPKRSNKSSMLMAASLIGLVLSLGALIYFVSQNKQSQGELAVLKQQVDTLRTASAAQQQEVLAYSQTMQMMHVATYKKIELTSVPGKPSAMAQVFWNTKTKEVYIADVSLPQAPSDKQYQLWAIVDGKPVDAGVVDDCNGLCKMKNIPNAQAFAITLEKKGGSPTPTLSAMYVMGKV